jgi:hypothetical protein
MGERERERGATGEYMERRRRGKKSVVKPHVADKKYDLSRHMRLP